MSLMEDLLEQATYLAMRETAGPPKQASLRRAVSAAYYAVFHLLTKEAAAVCSPASPSALRLRVQRAFDHGRMKEVCKSIRNGSAHATTGTLLHPATGFSPQIRTVATAFFELQEARHIADYDVTYKHSRTYSVQWINQASNAFTAWQTVRGTNEANVFLAALLLQDKWGR